MHRPPDLARAHQHRDVLRIDRRLHAEGAADILRDHPQFVVRHAHDGGCLAAQGVGALRAGVQRVAAALLVMDAGGAARFHRGHHQALVGDADARDMRRLGDDAGNLAFVLLVGRRARPVDAEIARRVRKKLHLAGHGGFQVDHRRQFLVVDRDLLGSVLRRGARFRHHHGHRIADVHDYVARERGAERHHHLGAAASDDRRVARDAGNAGRLDVLGGEHRQHVFGLQRRFGMDRQHAGVGMRRAHEGGVGLVRQPRVVHEAAIAAHQSVVLDARLVFAVGRVGRGHGEVPALGLRGSVYNRNRAARQGLASAAHLRHSDASQSQELRLSSSFQRTK